MALAMSWLLRRHHRQFGHIFIPMTIHTRDTANAIIHATRHRDDSRTHHFDDPNWAEEFDHAFDLVFRSGNLNNHRIRSHIHDTGAEDLSQPINFSATLGADLYFDQSQITGHRRLVRDVLHINDINQLIKISLNPMRVDVTIWTVN